MSSTLAPVCILLAFVAAGYCLSCTNCVNKDGTTCSGDAVTCPADQVCAALLSSTITAGKNDMKMFASFCAPQQECGVSGSISFSPSSKKIFASSCCSTDKCTPATPTLPDNKDQPNGVTCPTCISDSSKCIDEGNMQCTGSEDMCFAGKTTETSSPVEVRGCASKSACDIASKSQESIFKHLNITANSPCTSGSTKEVTGETNKATTEATKGTINEVTNKATTKDTKEAINEVTNKATTKDTKEAINEVTNKATTVTTNGAFQHHQEFLLPVAIASALITFMFFRIK
uniref:UPAR/Ly6 domain-containing protein n=1 Tax=Xenopus tropicalis TaxID=8364 RepID=A0A1B8XVH6_XENTR|eukprot:XP_002944220.1 PREDICTED: phospholipase A2 inhibitor subunit gamma B-like [Xenopus tropicalis]